MFAIAWGALICVLLILAWAALCVSKYKKWHRRRVNCTQELEVKVTDVLKRKAMRGGYIYKPVFESVDDDHYVIDSAYYSNLVSFEIGETLTLLVNPDDKKEFLYKDDSLNRGKVADIVCCILPAPLVIGFIIMLI